MPRTYVRKKESAYSDATLKLAILEVEKGKSIYLAAQEHKIPYHTLRRWVIKKPSHIGSGRKPWLTEDEELCIVQSLKFLAQCGHPFDRTDLSNLIEGYFKLPTSRKSPFGGKSPGIEYLRNFEKRWAQELTKRKPELLTKARAASLSRETVDLFFEMYENQILKNNLQDYPDRIFNLDEAGMGTDSRNKPVFIPKSARFAYMKSPTCGKTMFTVLFCTSASGHYMPPFTIYKSAHLYESWTKGGPPGATYACTNSGWMEDSVFESWFNQFVIFTKNLQKPVLLIYDGHGSHITYGTIKKAVDNNIIILCIPPHTSHALQPLDVGVFSPLKKVWKSILKKWFRESRLQNVSKAVFPFLLRQLMEAIRPENAIKGFKGSGLFPINKSEVEKKILFTGMTASDKSLISPSEEVRSEPSTSSANNNPEGVDKPVISDDSILESPLKDLKRAILNTLSPPISDINKKAVENSKRKRKRIQAKIGEVLTEAAVVQRLEGENEDRIRKKTKKVPKTSESDVNLTNTSVRDTNTLKTTSVGSWVLVNYQGKKSCKQFVGQIIEINEDLASVKYLTKSKFGDYYTFPEKDDVDEIETSNILKIFTEPTFNSRGHYKFEM